MKKKAPARDDSQEIGLDPILGVFLGVKKAPARVDHTSMAYISMAYISMAYISMAYVSMAYKSMAYISTTVSS